jgi:hypothetical protein
MIANESSLLQKYSNSDDGYYIIIDNTQKHTHEEMQNIRDRPRGGQLLTPHKLLFERSGGGNCKAISDGAE